MKLRYCALLLAALPLGALAAEEPPRSDVNFTVVTEKEIPRDLLQATLYVRTEGNNLGVLNKQINEKVEGALNLLKTQPDVVLRSNNRDSQIRYNNQGKKNGWIVDASLVVESKNFQAFSELLNQLSEHFAIEDMSASVSKEARKELENELTEAVLLEFNSKAQLIQKSLNAKGYRVVDLDLDLPKAVSEERREMMRAKAYTAELDEASFNPAGKQILKARINARIALIND
ncbi:MAG: SIMPL domain-containing protein [Haemophilus pittmaniae]|uniref:SIMPL domain-containing protein n=1 Tax=Haemophilus pittmaniae TaxID=249188 RepID=UPI0023F026F7|nr:SIMPL domain-containing protein [Haemophilus pittmaniae]MBS6026908.1 SIMPL domain-containing protein [Haemophilus pittmaniae]